MIHATVKKLPLYIPYITVVPVALNSVSRMLLVPLTLQFHSMKTFEKTNMVESPELHDVALCGPTAIFNDSQSCFGNGGLAWRRFCLLFCWAACNVQNRTPLKPRVGQTIFSYFWLKECKPFLPLSPSPPNFLTLV